MTKTLRVELADLEGIPHSSAPANTTVTVSARYTGPVILTDGTIIPTVPKSESMGSNGRVDFTVYTSDSPDVREDHHGFAVRVDAKVTEPSGRSYTYTRTVKPLEYQTDIVRLGRMPSAEGLPPQWVTVGDLVGDIEAAAGTAEWAGITDKPATFPPAEHDHAMGDVTGLVDQLSGEAQTNYGDIPFGPGEGFSTGDVAAAAFESGLEALTGIAGLTATKADAANTPGFVTVVTGNEERPINQIVVFWIGGTTEPVNMETGDVWLEQ